MNSSIIRGKCVGENDKIMKSMIKASELAHKMAFNLVYCNQCESLNDEEGDEEEIEFEINKDFVEFYKESLKYKLEKSLFFTFISFIFIILFYLSLKKKARKKKD